MTPCGCPAPDGLIPSPWYRPDPALASARPSRISNRFTFKGRILFELERIWLNAIGCFYVSVRWPLDVVAQRPDLSGPLSRRKRIRTNRGRPSHDLHSADRPNNTNGCGQGGTRTEFAGLELQSRQPAPGGQRQFEPGPALPVHVRAGPRVRAGQCPPRHQQPERRIASAALMLDHFGLHEKAHQVEAAIEAATGAVT